jgi:hypothetical protein
MTHWNNLKELQKHTSQSVAKTSTLSFTFKLLASKSVMRRATDDCYEYCKIPGFPCNELESKEGTATHKRELSARSTKTKKTKNREKKVQNYRPTQDSNLEPPDP